jgi:tetratricopeptide (TPR) repeat protein
MPDQPEAKSPPWLSANGNKRVPAVLLCHRLREDHMLNRLTRSLALAVTCAALAAPAFAVDSGGGDAASLPSLTDARHQIDGQHYKAAIDILKQLIAANPSDADALNLMGFSLRKSGDEDRALGFYLKALKVNPNHRGVNEYLGELYVETGQIEKAKERLEALKRICGGTTCEEYEDLAEAIASL